MTRSGNWKQVERLPHNPEAAVMTSGGYWLKGRFYPTHRAAPKVVATRRGWFR